MAKSTPRDRIKQAFLGRRSVKPSSTVKDEPFPTTPPSGAAQQPSSSSPTSLDHGPATASRLLMSYLVPSPSPTRRNRTSSAPPRPPNSWILYRRDKNLALQAQRSNLRHNGHDDEKESPSGKKACQGQVSSIVANLWANEDPALKRKYVLLAEEYKRKHREMYPDYKFQPLRKTKMKMTSDEDNDDDDDGNEDEVSDAMDRETTMKQEKKDSIKGNSPFKAASKTFEPCYATTEAGPRQHPLQTPPLGSSGERVQLSPSSRGPTKDRSAVTGDGGLSIRAEKTSRTARRKASEGSLKEHTLRNGKTPTKRPSLLLLSMHDAEHNAQRPSIEQRETGLDAAPASSPHSLSSLHHPPHFGEGGQHEDEEVEELKEWDYAFLTTTHAMDHANNNLQSAWRSASPADRFGHPSSNAGGENALSAEYAPSNTSQAPSTGMLNLAFGENMTIADEDGGFAGFAASQSPSPSAAAHDRHSITSSIEHGFYDRRLSHSRSFGDGAFPPITFAGSTQYMYSAAFDPTYGGRMTTGDHLSSNGSALSINSAPPMMGHPFYDSPYSAAPLMARKASSSGCSAFTDVLPPSSPADSLTRTFAAWPPPGQSSMSTSGCHSASTSVADLASIMPGTSALPTLEEGVPPALYAASTREQRTVDGWNEESDMDATVNASVLAPLLSLDLVKAAHFQATRYRFEVPQQQQQQHPSAEQREEQIGRYGYDVAEEVSVSKSAMDSSFSHPSQHLHHAPHQHHHRQPMEGYAMLGRVPSETYGGYSSDFSRAVDDTFIAMPSATRGRTASSRVSWSSMEPGAAHVGTQSTSSTSEASNAGCMSAPSTFTEFFVPIDDPVQHRSAAMQNYDKATQDDEVSLFERMLRTERDHHTS